MWVNVVCACDVEVVALWAEECGPEVNVADVALFDRSEGVRAAPPDLVRDLGLQDLVALWRRT